MKTVYFDMDGVLVDLALGLSSAEGYDDPVLWFMHSQKENGDLSFQNVIEKHIDNNIFRYLPRFSSHVLMDDVIQKLKIHKIKINILSSIGNKEFKHKIAEQKLNWLNFYMPNTFEEVYFVEKSSHKVEFIKDENTFLVDDYVKLKKVFSENGVENQLILYKNMHQVWLELRNKLKI